MIDEMRELAQFRADPPPADPAAMSRTRAALVHHATTGRARRPRWRIPAMVATGAAVAAGLLILPAIRDNGPAAYAVTTNPDGTVTVEVSDLTDMAGANEKLRELGIRAELLGYHKPGSCEPAAEPGGELPAAEVVLPRPAEPSNVLTFRPDKIPADGKLVMFGMLMPTVDVTAEGDMSEVSPTPSVLFLLLPADSGTCVEYPVVVDMP